MNTLRDFRLAICILSNVTDKNKVQSIYKYLTAEEMVHFFFL